MHQSTSSTTELPASKKACLDYWSLPSNYSIETAEYTLMFKDAVNDKQRPRIRRLKTTPRQISLRDSENQLFLSGKILGKGAYGAVSDLKPASTSPTYDTTDYRSATPIQQGDYVIKQVYDNRTVRSTLPEDTIESLKSQHGEHPNFDQQLDILQAINQHLIQHNVADQVIKHKEKQHQKLKRALQKEADANRQYHQGTAKADAVKVLEGTPYTIVEYDLKNYAAIVKYGPALALHLEKEPGENLYDFLINAITNGIPFQQLLTIFQQLTTIFKGFVKKGMIHADANPFNFMVDGYNLMPIDFGFEQFEPKEGGTQPLVEVMIGRPYEYHRPNRTKPRDPSQKQAEYTEIGEVDDTYALTRIIINMLTLHQNVNQYCIHIEASSEMLSYFEKLINTLAAAPANSTETLLPVSTALELFQAMVILKEYPHCNDIISCIDQTAQQFHSMKPSFTGVFQHCIDDLSRVINKIDDMKRAYNSLDALNTVETLPSHVPLEDDNRIPPLAPTLHRAKSDSSSPPTNSQEDQIMHMVPPPKLVRAITC